MGNFKYVQDKDKSGGYLELKSECPLLGVFNFNTQHRVSNNNIHYTGLLPITYINNLNIFF